MNKLGFIFCIALLASMPAAAHHNWATAYNVTEPEIEIEGVVSSVSWTNPHIQMSVTVDKGKPTEQDWQLVSSSVAMMSRMNVDGDMFKAGDKVRVAGFSARQSNHGMYMNHLQLAGGLELIFLRDAEPRWPGAHIGDTDALSGRVEEADINKRPESIFAVWNTIYGDPGSHAASRPKAPAPEGAAANRPAPAAPAPEQTADAYCSPKVMTMEMDNPYPIQFVKVGNDIQLKLEEYDTVRTFHMTSTHNDSAAQESLMGYSTGVWEGNKLVVTTTKVTGTGSAKYLETFQMRDDRDHVDYTLTTVDAGNARPAAITKYWKYVPGTVLQPYNCTNPTD